MAQPKQIPDYFAQAVPIRPSLLTCAIAAAYGYEAPPTLTKLVRVDRKEARRHTRRGNT